MAKKLPCEKDKIVRYQGWWVQVCGTAL